MSVSFCIMPRSSPIVVTRGQPANFEAHLQAAGLPQANSVERAAVTYTLPPVDLTFSDGSKQVLFNHAVTQNCTPFPDGYTLQGSFTGNVFIDARVEGEDHIGDQGTVSIVVV